jgi:hypothetical protein
MSPGSIAWQIEAEAVPGLVVGGRGDADGRAAESGGRLGHEEGDRRVGLLVVTAEIVHRRVTRSDAGGVGAGEVGRRQGRAMDADGRHLGGGVPTGLIPLKPERRGIRWPLHAGGRSHACGCTRAPSTSHSPA